MKIGAWNIDGILKQIDSIKTLMEEHEKDTDFLFLSEIKCDMSDLIEAEDNLGEYIVRGNTPDQYITDRTLRIRKAAKNQQSGVAIVSPVQKSPDLSELKSHTHRLQALRIQNDDMNLLMISIYAPTNGDKGKQIEFAKFLRYLSAFIQDNRRDSHVIIGGDLNVSATHKESRRALVTVKWFDAKVDCIHVVGQPC